MNAKLTGSHIASEEVVDYCEGLLSEMRESEIEEHMSICNECADRAHQVYGRREALERWTAESHGEAYWADRIRQTAEHVGRADATMRERLKLLSARAFDVVRGALQLVIAAPHKASQFVLESVSGPWQPAMGSGAVRSRGSVRKRGAAARPPAIASVVSKRSPSLQVTVNELSQVMIRWKDAPAGAESSLVMLIPDEPVDDLATRSRVELLERRAGESFPSASFKDMKPGKYRVFFEAMG